MTVKAWHVLGGVALASASLFAAWLWVSPAEAADFKICETNDGRDAIVAAESEDCAKLFREYRDGRDVPFFSFALPDKAPDHQCLVATGPGSYEWEPCLTEAAPK